VTAENESRFVEMIFPEQANHYGTLFGGTALALMGKAAFVAASRFVRHPVVMAASERVDFHAPVRVGQMVELVARVERTGRTSLGVAVEMHVESPAGPDRRVAVTGHFVMVTVDAAGRPVPLDSLPPAAA